MCIHDRHYGDEYCYLSNLFNNRLYFSKKSMLQFENISRDEKQLCIFNRYSAKIDIFKCILDLDIVRKPCYKWNNFIWFTPIFLQHFMSP